MSPPASTTDRPGVIVTHPNRGRAVVQTTRATVVLLLLVSTALILIVTVGGWSTLEGLKPVLIGWVAVYLIMAYFAARWRRGVLPMAAALALLMLVFALVAAPEWFVRDKPGYAEPNLPANFLGVITLVIVPVQLLLIVFTMRGFSQGWNVELEQLDPSFQRDTLPHSA